MYRYINIYIDTIYIIIDIYSLDCSSGFHQDIKMADQVLPSAGPLPERTDCGRVNGLVMEGISTQ